MLCKFDLTQLPVICSWNRQWHDGVLMDLNVFLDLLVFIFYAWLFCPHVCLCNMSISYIHRGQKTHDLGLQMSISHCVGSGNWTQISYKKQPVFFIYWAIAPTPYQWILIAWIFIVGATFVEEKPVPLKSNLLLIFSKRKDNLMGCKMFSQKAEQSTE